MLLFRGGFGHLGALIGAPGVIDVRPGLLVVIEIGYSSRLGLGVN